MTRTRIILTLILVATVAMLVGLLASGYLVRHLAPRPDGNRPAATEPQRPQPAEDVPANV